MRRAEENVEGEVPSEAEETLEAPHDPRWPDIVAKPEVCGLSDQKTGNEQCDIPRRQSMEVS